MKHKCADIIKTKADIIKAKADCMELVLIINTGNEWKLARNDFPALIHANYYLCHKKHTDQVINWLNGGDVYVDYGDGDRELLDKYADEPWLSYEWYMLDRVESYIDIKEPKKPKKEIRWIIVSKNPGSGIGVAYNQCIGAYNFHSDAVDVRDSLSNKSDLQIIEIEIEVN